jgi:hypothetical protein
MPLVRQVPVIRGYRPLLVRLAQIYKRKDDLARLGRTYERKDDGNERAVSAAVLMALADFLAENGLLLSLRLLDSASTLTDPQGSKALPSKTWRRFAFVSLGIRALTIDGISRQEATQRAVRSVKGLGDTRIVLQRYDEFRKDRVALQRPSALGEDDDYCHRDQQRMGTTSRQRRIKRADG